MPPQNDGLGVRFGKRRDPPGFGRSLEFAGPLFGVAVSPALSVVRIGGYRALRALPRDRSRRRVERDLQFEGASLRGRELLLASPSKLLPSTHRPGPV